MVQVGKSWKNVLIDNKRVMLVTDAVLSVE